MNYARYATIHARHLPTKICLIERTPSTNARRTLTWKQFNEEINKVANYLSVEPSRGSTTWESLSKTAKRF